jgi:hypothetical protein
VLARLNAEKHRFDEDGWHVSYLLLFVLFIFLLDRKIRQGPVVEAPVATSAKRYVPESPKEH